MNLVISVYAAGTLIFDLILFGKTSPFTYILLALCLFYFITPIDHYIVGFLKSN